MTFEAGRDYLFTSNQVQNVMQDKGVNQRTYKLSKADMRLTSFHVGVRRVGPQRLLFFNGGGGFGDQIMTWPVCKILNDIGFEVHILTDPGNNVCWWNQPFVKTIQTVPMAWESVKMFDYTAFFEHVANMDEHQDQLHPVDIMLHRLGIDPSSVDAKLKVVRPQFTYAEAASVQQFNGKAIGLYQLAAANPVRCLQPGDSAFILTKLAEAFPDIHWLAVYDEFVPEDYVKALHCTECEGKGEKDGKKCKECDGHKYRAKNIEPKLFPNLRELWALTEHAKVVVSPDSMMVHVAGSMSVPCVGLWGPVDPTRRVQYYANHTALFPKQFCPHAPCFTYGPVFPKYCPPRPGTAGRKTCEVLAGIAPDEVCEAVAKIRRA